MDLRINLSILCSYQDNDPYTKEEQEVHNSFVDDLTDLLERYCLKDNTTIYLKYEGDPPGEGLVLGANSEKVLLH